VRKDGYVVINWNYKLHLAHRMAWLYVYGEWPTKHIDHIDRNPTNNAISNLRDVPRWVNKLNVDPQSNNTSGHPGVDLLDGRWRVRCCDVHVGCFATFAEAVTAYNTRKTELMSPYNGNMQNGKS
jgi:hypothetical protein